MGFFTLLYFQSDILTGPKENENVNKTKHQAKVFTCWQNPSLKKKIHLLKCSVSCHKNKEWKINLLYFHFYANYIVYICKLRNTWCKTILYLLLNKFQTRKNTTRFFIIRIEFLSYPNEYMVYTLVRVQKSFKCSVCVGNTPCSLASLHDCSVIS